MIKKDPTSTFSRIDRSPSDHSNEQTAFQNSRRRFDSGTSTLLPRPHFDCSNQQTIFDYLLLAEKVLKSRASSEAKIATTMREIYGVLWNRKLQTRSENWRQFIMDVRQHSICDVLHEDPFTYRAFSKPRGYAGDAVLMDYIYGEEEKREPPKCSWVGERIYHWTATSSACRGVMARRGFTADAIDKIAQETEKPSVLSLAAGHLREASLSASVRRRQLGRFVAIDSDAESLDEISRSFPRAGIDCVHASARRIITGKIDVGQFDLVYSSGLYDYLNDSIAIRLTTKLFSMVKPGGVLLLTNFLPNIECIGYMETFMDWNLIYRNRFQMMELTADIPESEIKRVCTFAEDDGNIVFSTVHKTK